VDNEIGKVLIKCPSTGKDVATGFAMSQEDWEVANIKVAAFKCRECGDMHNWSKHDGRLVFPAKKK
jgi:hypothetical protein